MRKTLNLKDGVAEIGQTIWWVDGSELKSQIVTLVMTDLLESESFTERCDDATPCFVTKAALLDYCQANEIECVELERDVYKERLAALEKPKTDMARFKDLCNDFGLYTSQYGIADKSFVSLWDNNYETRFVFDANGAFVNDFNTQPKED